MAKDFKASQVKTSKIIVSGTTSGNPALLIYSASDSTNQSGGFQSDMLSNVGSDVFLFISGNNNSLQGTNRTNVTLFGGDVVVSGTFFAEKMVAEVTTTTYSDHYISGGLFLSQRSSDPSPSSTQVALYSSASSGVAKLYFRNSNGIVEIGSGSSSSSSSTATGTFNVPSADKFVTTSSVSLAGGKGFSYTADSQGVDTFFFVSGTINSRGTSTQGTTVFGGDVFISGSLYDSSGSLVSGGVSSSTSTGTFNVPSADKFVTTSSVSLAGSQGFAYTADSQGVDTFFFVSGSIQSRGTSTQGTAVFGGDVFISGSLYNSSGSLIESTSITVTSGSTSINNISSIDVSHLGVLGNNGGGNIALTGTIGPAEDGLYTDGLFTTFTATTPIGTAIDKINEVLAYLAPSQAPVVGDVNASGIEGTSAILSFGASSGNNPAGYVTASVALGNSLSSVDITGSYSVSTGSSVDLRAGIFNTSTNVSGFINSSIAQSDYNSGAIINHVSQSFGEAEQGILTLNLNGTNIVSINLAHSTTGSGVPGSGTANYLDSNGSGFTHLSQTGSARTQGDVAFPLFYHRTGKVLITEASQNKGYNYFKVTHTVGTSNYTTNFVEWIYDEDGTDVISPISTSDPSFSMNSLSGGTNQFNLSGVKYNVSSSGEYRVRIENFYKNVYAQNGITGTLTNSTISVTTPSTVPHIGVSEDHTKAIHVTSSFTTNVGALLGGIVTGNVSVSHPTKTGLTNSGSLASGKFLIYSGTNASTNTFESFEFENYRIQSASYVEQADVLSSGNIWNSLVHMTASNGGHSDGLQFYSGALMSPTNTLNGGNFSNSDSYFGTNYIYDNNPNYSAESGLRTFYRKVQNTTGNPIRDFRIQINASQGAIPTIVSQGTILDSTKMKIFARAPSVSGSEWLDLGSLFAYHTTSNRSGGRANTTLNTGGSPTNYFTFGTSSIPAGDYFVVKVEADASLTRHIGGLTFAMPGIAGSPNVAPNVSTLNLSTVGVTGSLSFGNTLSITGYNNVTGSAPFFSGTVDINENFDIVSNRFGIFDNSTAVTGIINYDVASNGYAYTADAFGGGNAHTGTLKLEVNDDIVHTVDLANLGLSGESKTSGSGFQNLTTPTNAIGTNNLVKDYTKFYRTGEFVVATSDFQAGRNYAKVIHSVTGTDYVTGYVEWISDFDNNPMSIVASSFTGVEENNELYYQSGVKYFQSPLVTFKSHVSHPYSNVYSSDGNAITILGQTNLNPATFIEVTGSGIINNSASSHEMALPLLDTGVANPEIYPIFVTGTLEFNQSTSIPGTSPVGGTSYSAAAKINVLHPLDGQQTSGNIYVGGSSDKKFLVYSASLGSTSLYTSERFSREDYRIVSGNYTSQGSISTGVWNSSTNINNISNVNYYTGLLTYNGTLISPIDSRLLGAGDFRSYFDIGSSDIIGPSSNVNYSSLPVVSSSHRHYFRKFENNTANSVFNVDITLYGDANIVGKSGAVSGSLGANDNIYVEGKIPGKTGWLDLGAATAGSGNITDGDGGLSGDLTQVITTDGQTNTLTFNGQTVSGTGVGADQIILKITAHKNWTGYLSRIDVNY